MLARELETNVRYPMAWLRVRIRVRVGVGVRVRVKGRARVSLEPRPSTQIFVEGLGSRLG